MFSSSSLGLPGFFSFTAAVFFLGCGPLLKASQPEKMAQADFFEKKIRPLLSESCLECHSAASKVKGGLRMDSRAAFFRGGDSGVVVVPGHPEKSLLFEAVSYSNVDFQMPPKSRLDDRDVAILRQWIEEGAYWPESPGGESAADPSAGEFDIESRLDRHWWRNSVRRPEIPGESGIADSWNAVDRFIHHRLEESGLDQSPVADRRTLVRRMFFDLIGLPPSPVELEKWVSSGQSLEVLADQLLDSPHFGEKWAQHWLDLVRYSETLGHEFDYAMPNAWRYRDYLIRSLNTDVPYDRLVLEHVAGDLVEDPRYNPTDGTNDSIKGTAFYWLGQQVHSPVDLLGNQAEVTDNQIDVLTKTFLGLTVSCARCHDHKFDAISTRDYYSLYGSMTSSRYHQASIDAPEVREPSIAAIRSLRDQLDARVRAVIAAQESRLESELAVLRKFFSAADGNSSSDLPESDGTFIFEDFESGSFEGRWEVEGEAFGIRPLQSTEPADYQGDVRALGRFLVNSHNRPVEGGLDQPSDSRTGSLTSREIEVGHRYLHFLIGGGSHSDRTGLQILVGDKVVHHQSGFDSNRMRPVTIELSRWTGQSIRLRIIDQHQGGWGNTCVDHIVFSDFPVYFNESDNSPLNLPDNPSVFAGDTGMSGERLAHLVRKVIEGKSRAGQPGDTLAALAQAVLSAPGGTEDPAATQWPQTSITGDALIWSTSGKEDPLYSWRFHGEAFRDCVVAPGQLIPDEGGVVFAELPGIHSATVDPRLEGSASSGTFVIGEPYLHVLCSGHDTRINVVLENFNLIRGPIYDGIKKKPDWSTPRWMTFDLSMWVGSDAYLQINDMQVNDLAGPGSSPRATGAIFAVQASADRQAPDLHDGYPSGGFMDLTREAVKALNSDDAPSSSRIAWINQLISEELIDVDSDPEVMRLTRAIREISDRMPAPKRVPAMVEGYGRNEEIFIRGNPRNRGTTADRGFLEAFGKDQHEMRGSGRLEFAQWMLDPDNPLTTRVYVNRVWQHLFGEGLVPTVDDMGLMGQEPSHPQLLDWLADWFRNEGQWSTRKLIRLLVTSRTYQISAEPVGTRWREADPTNRYLHSARIRRLPAELIRDNILAVSGALNRDQFGQPVRVHLTGFMEGRGRPGQSGPLDGNGRRSVYQEVRRNFLSPMLLAFDKPIPFTSVGRRTRSNVPAQALILMNDPFVQEQAKVMARRLIRETVSSAELHADRIRLAYQLAFGRLPQPDEIDQAGEFILAQAQVYGVEPGHEAPLADFCHTLFNLKEFIFIH